MNAPPAPNSNTTTQTTPLQFDFTFDPEVNLRLPLLDNATELVLQLTFLVVLSLICGLFGTVTNIINIVIFIKQGLFSGGSTLNLFFLAVADLGVVFTNFLHGIGFSVIVAKIPHLPVDLFSVIYLAIGWPHAIFMNINRMLTAYVAFERCMCVVIPFRVKNIFAPKRSLVYLVLIFTYGFLSHVPIYMTHGLGAVKQEGGNTTIIALIFLSGREFWHDLVYYGNYLVLDFLTVVIVVICTVVTTAYVSTSKKWREKVSNASATTRTDDDVDTRLEVVAVDNSAFLKSSKTKTLTGNRGEKSEKSEKKLSKTAIDKETKLVKMITTISAIFCVCFIPEVSLLIVRSVDPRINTRGQYERLSHILYAVKFLGATVNSSINIFVYYRMSSKYKQIFQSCFGGNK